MFFLLIQYMRNNPWLILCVSGSLKNISNLNSGKMIKLVVKKRYRAEIKIPSRFPEIEEIKGYLPGFCKPLGLDFIITEENKVLFIEMQHGFGRKGLMELFPNAKFVYRKTLGNMRREYGKSLYVSKRMREICNDKITTYNHFPHYQPSSFVYKSNKLPQLKEWLSTLDSDYVLAKPPRGCCGEGILVLKRNELQNADDSLNLGSANLLQEYIPSKKLYGSDGKPHIGCIRHIILLHSDGETMGFAHFPSYWRVSPSPYGKNADRESFTANISRGAYPIEVNKKDTALLRPFAEQICKEFICQILQLPDIKSGPSFALPMEGDINEYLRETLFARSG